MIDKRGVTFESPAKQVAVKRQVIGDSMDLVRVFALCLVTAQHALSLLERDEHADILGLSIGQIGVAIFAAVSGILASESGRTPVSWLFQRMRRIFPSYWIAVAMSFLLSWVSGHKHFDSLQVVAQMVGIGLFTHGSKLVNLPTWFVSLLLVCYLGTFVARLTRVPGTIAVGTSLLLAIMVGVETHPWLLSHFLTYSIASTVALLPRGMNRRVITWTVAGILFLLGIFEQVAFGYTTCALVTIELALAIPRVPLAIRWAAEYSYEYYLVHGVTLFGIIRLLPGLPLAAVFSAILLAAAAAVVLRKLTDRAVMLVNHVVALWMTFLK